ncbi:MAG: esterase/lipase family protein [Acutalibacteraceae bacterium]
MKKVRKIISVLLAALILVSAFSTLAGAEPTAAVLAENNDAAPFVFVHGLGGWGQYDEITEIMPYWGGGAGMTISNGDIIGLLRNNGYEAYAASVSPVGSAWDRACELYAQLTGTVVDYGEAHSKEHNHERYGKSYVDNPLMGRVWDLEEQINLVAHSFGGPTSRLFVSLLTYGDETERETSGEDVSGLFTGGHSKAVKSVTTLSGVHNGSQVANMIYDFAPSMYLIGLLINTFGAFGSQGAMGDIGLAHFGLTPKEPGERVPLSISNIKNFVKVEDNAGYDLTIRGSRELNEKIKMSPDTYYYSYSGYITETNVFGRQYNKAGCAPIFYGTCFLINSSEGKTFDGIEMTGDWIINDGMVPLASAKYPLDEADNAYSYEQAAQSGSIEPGTWYYMEPLYSMDHGDYCNAGNDYPDGYENFYLELVKVVEG